MHEGVIDMLTDRSAAAENEGRDIRLDVGETRLLNSMIRTLNGQFGDRWYPDWIKRHGDPETE